MAWEYRDEIALAHLTNLEAHAYAADIYLNFQKFRYKAGLRIRYEKFYCQPTKGPLRFDYA